MMYQPCSSTKQLTLVAKSWRCFDLSTPRLEFSAFSLQHVNQLDFQKADTQTELPYPYDILSGLGMNPLKNEVTTCPGRFISDSAHLQLPFKLQGASEQEHLTDHG